MFDARRFHLGRLKYLGASVRVLLVPVAHRVHHIAEGLVGKVAIRLDHLGRALGQSSVQSVAEARAQEAGQTIGGAEELRKWSTKQIAPTSYQQI